MAPPRSRKLAVMGFRSVGKSSLTIQFVEGQFVDSYDPTIENTFAKTIRLKGQDYNVELVDTAGQDEYSLIPQSYTVDIHGYVLVYSVTSVKSFEVVKDIRERLLDMTGSILSALKFAQALRFATETFFNSSKPWLFYYVPIVQRSMGNKTDLHMERIVSYEQGKTVADSWRAVFVESSAKENKCVREIFHSIIEEIEKLQNGSASKDKENCTIL